jgi:hypothetical protein
LGPVFIMTARTETELVQANHSTGRAMEKIWRMEQVRLPKPATSQFPTRNVRPANCGLGYERFSKRRKDRLHQTEHPTRHRFTTARQDAFGLRQGYGPTSASLL